jgi:hypothetical protein
MSSGSRAQSWAINEHFLAQEGSREAHFDYRGKGDRPFGPGCDEAFEHGLGIRHNRRALRLVHGKLKATKRLQIM